MALIQDWMPPNREHYEQILFLWQLFPLFASLQWLISWYGMGKTSVDSRLNLPGRIAWLTMECPGFLTLLYVFNTLPREQGIADLPWQNKVLASFFVLHYAYRAVLFPVLQPSISPLHVVVWAFALVFQLFNGSLLGAWLAAYGPTTQDEWRAQLAPFGVAQFALGSVLWFGGLLANYYHDDELREIRRRVADRQRRDERQQQQQQQPGQQRNRTPVEKHYQIPQAGLFRYMLYPHYFVEWIEWTGYWVMCGWTCKPALAFVVNEVFAMLPRAVAGKRWYIQRFGADKVGKKWAVIPGVW